MTIKSKLRKMLDNPYAIHDKIRGINPNETIAFLQGIRFLGKIETLIDVGCNRGNFIRAGLRFNQNMKVYAFDPLKDVLQVKGKNITFFNFGLDEKKDSIDFYIPQNNAWSSTLKIKKGSNNFYEGIENYEKTTINVERFDNLNLKINRSCMLKVFTQGSELKVLKGFGERLEEIDIIKVEYDFDKCYESGFILSELICFLEGKGFNGFFQGGISYFGEENLDKLSHCYFLFFRIKGGLNGK